MTAAQDRNLALAEVVEVNDRLRMIAMTLRRQSSTFSIEAEAARLDHRKPGKRELWPEEWLALALDLHKTVQLLQATEARARKLAGQ